MFIIVYIISLSKQVFIIFTALPIVEINWKNRYFNQNKMEDFLVLSILDLQLDAEQHKAVNKKEVIAYVMLGDQCIDCLVLGSPNASLQDAKVGKSTAQNGESGG